MAKTGPDPTTDGSWSIPSHNVWTPSTSNAVIISRTFREPREQDVSQRMIQIGRSMNIIGPKLISKDRYESETLGQGARFEVFGHKPPTNCEAQEDILWEGIDVRYLAFKRAKTSLRKPDELCDPSTSWVAALSESQDNIGDIRSDEEKAKQLEQVAAVVREMKVLAKEALRNHANIIKLFAWGFDADDFNAKSLMTPILVEERAWGTLSELLRSRKLRVTERFNLCHDALQGLVAIHKEGLYHGDVNPKNMLVYQQEESIVAKISDFSHSGLLPTEPGDMIWYQGTKGWQAPEIELTLPTSKEDILALEAYSFGLVLWSSLGLGGESPLIKSPVDRQSIPTFVRSCLESYNLPLEIKNIVAPILPRLLDHHNQKRFWLSPELLEDKLELSGRGLILQSTSPTVLLMDDSFKQLDQFLKRRATTRKVSDDNGLTKDTDQKFPLIFTNPFLKLMMEEAYVRNIASRLNNLPKIAQLSSYAIPAYISDPSAYKPPIATELAPYTVISLHRLEEIDRERKAGRFTSLAAADLFDIAIGFYSFDTTRSLLYLRQAAFAGDVRAQAIYEPLSKHVKNLEEAVVPPDTLHQWEFDAIATGFLSRYQSANEVKPSARMAFTQFQENSGYNSYLYLAKDNIKTAQSFRIDFDSMKEFLCDARFGDYVGQVPQEGPEGNTILHWAVLCDHVEFVKKIVTKHAERVWGLNATNYRDETSLLWACRAGNAEIARILLEGGASANSRDGIVSPLHWLFAFPNHKLAKICELLISRRGRLNAIAPEIPMFHFPFSMPEGTPLVWAVAAGALTAVEVITNAIIADENISDKEKELCFKGALKMAMRRHEADMMKAMLQGASNGGLSLASIASEGFEWSVLEVPEHSDEIPVQATPLTGDWRDGLMRILRHGTTLNIGRNLDKTLGYVNSLQQKRVSESESNHTPTLAANFMYLNQVIVQHDSQSALRLLQRYGPVYSKDDLGIGLFTNIQHNWAVPSSYRFPVFMDIFRGLISAGADVNTKNPSQGGLGNTIAHIIVRKYSDESSSKNILEIRDLVILLLRVLRSCGADINRKNAVGMTVMDYALHNNRNYNLDEELVDMLHSWGSRSTFRLLPSRVEERIGNWESRQLEWKMPDEERVDMRQRGGNLAILWHEMEDQRRAAESALSEDDDEEVDPETLYSSNGQTSRPDDDELEDYDNDDEVWHDDISDYTACDAGNDNASILSEAPTLY